MTLIWWIRQVFLTLSACFFLAWGVNLLIEAFKLEDPFYFIMIFFASNLMILISATLLFGFVLRMVNMHKKERENDADL